MDITQLLHLSLHSPSLWQGKKKKKKLCKEPHFKCDTAKHSAELLMHLVTSKRITQAWLGGADFGTALYMKVAERH